MPARQFDSSFAMLVRLLLDSLLFFFLLLFSFSPKYVRRYLLRFISPFPRRLRPQPFCPSAIFPVYTFCFYNMILYTAYTRRPGPSMTFYSLRPFYVCVCVCDIYFDYFASSVPIQSIRNNNTVIILYRPNRNHTFFLLCRLNAISVFLRRRLLITVYYRYPGTHTL